MSAREAPEVLEHGVLRLLTAGSVDDGKSTLIGRLLYDTRAILADQLAAIARTSQRRGSELDLSLLTDGLLAEREQGITIDVAYRYFATPARKFIVADAPGHAQYTRNMATAASTAHLAILLVDVRNGVVTQTRRHAALAHLLGIRHLVVAVNKMDLVDYRAEAYAAVVEDFLAFAQRAGLEGVRFVPMSALAGDMIVERGERMPWYDGPTLLQILEIAEVDSFLDQAPFRFPVQYVARPEGDARRGYLGRVESGSVAVGDVVRVLPSGISTRVRALRTFDGALPHADLHAALTIELDDEVDVSRGDLIVRDGAAPDGTREPRADLCWMSPTPLDARRRFVMRHTTRDIDVRIARVDDVWNMTTLSREPLPETLAMNDIGRVTLATAETLYADRYSENPTTGSFILIDAASNDTVAAGMIR
jgi:sulfate adenylyltransferase subunit 1